MRTTIEELAYGEEKRIKVSGKYIKTLVRAVEGGEIIANAELLLLTDDSEEKTEVRILYAENGTMSEYVFCNMNRYIRNNTDLVDIISFNYVTDEITRTGVIIVAKAKTEELLNQLSKEFK